GGIFEQSGGLAVRIAHDHAAGGILALASDPRKLQRERVRQGHVAVIAVEEYRSRRRNCVDPIFAGKLDGRELLIVPVAAQQPLAFRSARNVLGNFLDESFFRSSALEVDLFKSRATRDEVHMGIVEAGQKQAAARIDNAGRGSSPVLDLSVGTDCNDAIAEHSDGLSIW